MKGGVRMQKPGDVEAASRIVASRADIKIRSEREASPCSGPGLVLVRAIPSWTPSSSNLPCKHLVFLGLKPSVPEYDL